jgi:AcrR family transcriptional regulator
MVDGRAARAQRTRDAVVDAVLALIEEGDLRPTAPRIAARAGVSARTVFQHFSDLESLFAAVAARAGERLIALLVPLSADGPIDDRIDAFVAQRVRVLEALTPIRRAAVLQEPFSAALRDVRQHFVHRSRVEIERVFAQELDARSAPERNEVVLALATMSSWMAWETLREHHGLSAEDAQAVLDRGVRALLSAH